MNLTTNINELRGFSDETPDTILQFHEYFVLFFIIAKFYHFAFFRLKHPNIIELLGFSNETPDTLCLIYPYMAEGTLKDALVKCKTPEANFVLSSSQRIGIMKGKTILVKTSFRYLTYSY